MDIIGVYRFKKKKKNIIIVIFFKFTTMSVPILSEMKLLPVKMGSLEYATYIKTFSLALILYKTYEI